MPVDDEEQQCRQEEDAAAGPSGPAAAADDASRAPGRPPRRSRCSPPAGVRPAAPRPCPPLRPPVRVARLRRPAADDRDRRRPARPRVRARRLRWTGRPPPGPCRRTRVDGPGPGRAERRGRRRPRATSTPSLRAAGGRARRPTSRRAPGSVSVVDGTSAVFGTGPLKRFIVEVEDGIDVDGAGFAAAVEATLGDPRSWGSGGRMSFQRVGAAEAAAQDFDFRVTLVSPGQHGDRTARASAPAATPPAGTATAPSSTWPAGPPPSRTTRATSPPTGSTSSTTRSGTCSATGTSPARVPGSSRR